MPYIIKKDNETIATFKNHRLASHYVRRHPGKAKREAWAIAKLPHPFKGVSFPHGTSPRRASQATGGGSPQIQLEKEG